MYIHPPESYNTKKDHPTEGAKGVSRGPRGMIIIDSCIFFVSWNKISKLNYTYVNKCLGDTKLLVTFPTRAAKSRNHPHKQNLVQCTCWKNHVRFGFRWKESALHFRGNLARILHCDRKSWVNHEMIHYRESL